MRRCTKCGEEKPLSDFRKDKKGAYGVGSWCKKCKGENDRKWYAANPERVREQKRKSAAANPDSGRKWAAANPDKKRENTRKWHAANPEKVREKDRKWALANPEKRRASDHNRRARKNGNGGKITAAEERWLFEFYDFTCLRCKRREPEIKLTLDHVVPLAPPYNGPNTIENAQCLCHSCNSSKGKKHIDYRPVMKLI